MPELIYDESTAPSNEPSDIIEPDYRQLVRSIVKVCYDFQSLRIQTGGRVFAAFCKKYDLTFAEASSKEEEDKDEDELPDELSVADDSEKAKKEKDKKAKKVIEAIRKSYRRIIDGMSVSISNDLEAKGIKKTRKAKGSKSGLLNRINTIIIPPGELISCKNELILVDQYEDILADEEKHFKLLETVLNGIPFYNDYLHTIRGIGPAMAGVIISEINIHKSKYSSSLHLYSGLDVAPDGKGRTRKAEHLIDVEYIDKNGEKKTKKSITYNPFLKTKLLGVLGPSFLRTKNPVYRVIYDNYKHRLQNRPDLKEHSKVHINRMAVRYMVKQFLNNLYENWRAAENLPVHDPYAVAKLGYNPHHSGPET